MDRPEGIYWVKDRRYGWTIARWNPWQDWWVLAWVSPNDPAARGGGVVSGVRFEAIGPKIEPPNVTLAAKV